MTNHDTTDDGKTKEIVAVRKPGADPRPSLARSNPEPVFLSQLIAERDGLPAQRLRRRAPVGVAVGAYANGEHLDQQRIPTGFFRSLSA